MYVYRSNILTFSPLFLHPLSLGVCPLPSPPSHLSPSQPAAVGSTPVILSSRRGRRCRPGPHEPSVRANTNSVTSTRRTPTPWFVFQNTAILDTWKIFHPLEWSFYSERNVRVCGFVYVHLCVWVYVFVCVKIYICMYNAGMFTLEMPHLSLLSHILLYFSVYSRHSLSCLYRDAF